MGQVWRGTDTTLGRQVAIKILPDAFAADPERLARFEREARTLASLNHPHIAAIYGFEKLSGMHALVMELVEGEDLSQRIAHHHVPRDDAGRDDPGHRRVYVAGAGARQGCGQARGHLGVWRGAVRDAGGAPPVRRRGPDRSARRSCSS